MNRSAPTGSGTENAGSPSVSYLKYNFLIVGNLSNVLPADVDYLESQGCFEVPKRDILDDIVQQYFLRMHTFLPILHEGDFWSAYYHRGALNPSIPQTSLLVFHAIMFISCNYASDETAKSLGFPTSREAKASFYRKAKLLYDFETETNPIYIAQAALILSFRASMDILSVKKATWLSIAIRHAETVGANNYTTLYPNSRPLSKDDAKIKNTLKRLWWGCIIRDRVLALCLRGGVQISRAQSELALASPFTHSDLDDEADHSNVYAPETKRYLARIFERFVYLCTVLTDALSLVYPLNERLRGPVGLTEEEAHIQKVQTRLREWHRDSAISLRDLARIKPPTTPVSQNDTFNAVTLYMNMMYIFYYSARISLTQHQAFRLVGRSSEGGVSPGLDQIREALQTVVSASTKSFKRLRELGLDRWLTSSAVACIATPLLLQILDVKLLNYFSASVDADIAAESHRRLSALFDNMNTYCTQFELVDFVVNVVQRVANSVQMEQLQQMLMTKVVYKWTDILTLSPEMYLRSVLVLDLSLSRGRLPQQGDFSEFFPSNVDESNSRGPSLDQGTLPPVTTQPVNSHQNPSPSVATFEPTSMDTAASELTSYEDLLNMELVEGDQMAEDEILNFSQPPLGHSELSIPEANIFNPGETPNDVFMGILSPEPDSFLHDANYAF